MFPPYTLNKCVSSAFRFLHSTAKSGQQTMQVWQAFGYGGIENLQLNPLAQMPVLTNTLDVLVKVHASSINPLDVRMLEGYGATTFNLARQVKSCSLTSEEFPLVLGRDFSGTVVHVGKNVKSLHCGDEVWGALSPWENGSHADYVLSSVCYTTKKPVSLSHTEAASFPYAALTAWSALCTFGGLSEKAAYGKRVLVIGSSGGVGTFAVQLLKAWGSEVTVICATDAVEMAHALGADNILDYQSPDFKFNLKELNSFDFIFDNVGKEYPDLTLDQLKKFKNSKYVTVVSPLLKNTDDRGVIFGTLLSGVQAGFDTAMSLKDGRSFRWAYFIPNACALKSIAKLIDNKQIKPIIDKEYKFEDILQAYQKVSSGHARGKTVVNHVAVAEEKNNKDTQENV